MKHIVLAIALLGATVTSSFAQNWVRPSETEMKAERQSLSSKTKELENLLAKHQTAKAEQAADELLTIMKKGVAQTRHVAETSGTQKETLMKTMLGLEQMVHDFRELAADVDKNGSKLIETAKAFQTKLPS
jgi:hypothetical protein